MKKLTLLTFLGLFSYLGSAQNNTMNNQELPFAQMNRSEADFGPGNMLKRMIDGLGFRYYYASENLRTEDLDYRPNPDARSTDETLDHIYDLSLTISNAAMATPNIRPSEKKQMTYAELRAQTLINFKSASDVLKDLNEQEVQQVKIIFQTPRGNSEFPVWNLINGPIADALTHVGQVASYRRSSGNPQRSGVNVFTGTAKE